jgi:AhpD family alkylhydroperoxidase
MEATPVQTRIWIDKQTPEAFKALDDVTAAVRTATDELGLDRKLVELVNVRVSQINGCAYCLDIHTRASRDAGDTEQRRAVLPGWRRTDLYTPREQAALALAEITAVIPDDATLEREYAFARLHLSEAEVSAVVWVAITIGAFNRVSILSRHPVRARKEK